MHAADLLLAVAALSCGVLGYPGMNALDFSAHASRSKADNELPGDLATLQDHELSAVGHLVKRIIKGGEQPKKRSYTPPGELGSDACNKDVCCVYSHVLKDVAPTLVDITGPGYGGPGSCKVKNRAVIRAGFHDAGATNTTLDYGGADGSLILADGEINRAENADLQEAAALAKSLYDKYHVHGAGAADLIQMLAIAVPGWCPGGARGTFLVGRKDSNRPPADGLLPSPKLEADAMVAFFAAKGINADELVALTGSHTTSRQNAFDPSHSGESQDSTPETFDNLYYKEMLAPNPVPGTLRFPSDLALSKGKDTQAKWQEFAADGAQDKFTKAYAAAYLKLSLLGVKNINELHDCTCIMPW